MKDEKVGVDVSVCPNIKTKKISEINFVEIEEKSEYVDLIESVLKKAFAEEKLLEKNLYVNVILTTPENIRKTNKQYRNIDKETDVLSFPMFEKEEIENIKNNHNNIPEVLGDIIVSIKKVEEQAKEYGHTFERELSYMIIHGFYHLIGYDHMEEEEKNVMREKEEKVLNKLNIKR